MIFKQWQQVLGGTKTQTRRIKKANEFASGNRNPNRIHAVWIDTRGIYDPKFEQGGFIRSAWVVLESLYRLKWVTAAGFHSEQTYAVQPGRGKVAVGRIRITGIRRERVQDISCDDIRAEGIQKQLDWVSLDMREAFAALWDGIYAKPGERWADNPEVWALTFEVVAGA